MKILMWIVAKQPTFESLADNWIMWSLHISHFMFTEYATIDCLVLASLRSAYTEDGRTLAISRYINCKMVLSKPSLSCRALMRNQNGAEDEKHSAEDSIPTAMSKSKSIHILRALNFMIIVSVCAMWSVWKWMSSWDFIARWFAIKW